LADLLQQAGQITLCMLLNGYSCTCTFLADSRHPKAAAAADTATVKPVAKSNLYHCLFHHNSVLPSQAAALVLLLLLLPLLLLLSRRTSRRSTPWSLLV
jgi:hypothetical protein